MSSDGLSAREQSRRRKWIYGVLMIALVVALFALGVPSTLGTAEVKGQPGGILAQYRDSHGLSQTELGQIDLTSETIRLGTLGMRGMAVEMFWIKANQFQMKKDWTSLRAALDQISKLQPHSIQVWKYQAWNLSYNVSVSFDDYHDKFYWVIEGLNFMLDGVKANDREPRLYWDMAWFISNKIGKDDAAKYYRRIFRGERDAQGNDPPEYIKDFREHFSPPPDAARGIAGGFPPGSNLLDNWHVGKAWFKAAEERIDPPRYPVRGMAQVIFYSDAPTCQFYYSDAQEKDGIFGQFARRAWQDAESEWHAYGEQAIDTSYDVKMQLNHKEEMFDAVEEKKIELDALAPGVREEVEKEKRTKLSPEERALWDAYRTELDRYMREKNNRKSASTGKKLLTPSVDVTLRDHAEAKPDEIARRVSQAHHQAAVELAKQIDNEETLIQWMTNERAKVNFDFWRTRARAEQTDNGLNARQAVHNGDQAFAKGDLIRARPEYEKGLLGWRRVLDDPEFHSLIEDVSLGTDLVEVIRRYDKCLEQDDKDRPDPFVLQDIIDRWGTRQGSPFPPVVSKSKPEGTDDKAKAPASAEKTPNQKDAPPAGKDTKRP